MDLVAASSILQPSRFLTAAPISSHYAGEDRKSLLYLPSLLVSTVCLIDLAAATSIGLPIAFSDSSNRFVSQWCWPDKLSDYLPCCRSVLCVALIWKRQDMERRSSHHGYVESRTTLQRTHDLERNLVALIVICNNESTHLYEEIINANLLPTSS